MDLEGEVLGEEGGGVDGLDGGVWKWTGDLGVLGVWVSNVRFVGVCGGR
jgi:hypothetical protein